MADNDKSRSKRPKLSTPRRAAGTEQLPSLGSPAASTPETPSDIPVIASPAAATAAARHDIPLFRLKNHFNETMQTDNVPLLSSWETYKQMLPLRESNHKTRLIAECPYWARLQEVTDMAVQLETPGDQERIALPYLADSSHSGKTASILVAFLDSCESKRASKFTHYFYLPFSNNRGKHFAYAENPNHKGNLSEAVREAQGAYFVFQCVQFLLEQGPLTSQQLFVHVPDPSSLPPTRKTTDKIDAILNKNIPGKDCRILFHVDEHQKMNKDECFRRGALEALARCDRAVCVITYTEIPSEVAAAGSSEVCRRPVIKPLLDMTQVFKHIDALNVLSLLKGNGFERRAWATLVFKLAWHIRPMMLPIHLGLKEQFLSDFDHHRKAGNISECLKLCSRQVSHRVGTPQKGAVRLMAGIADEDLPKLDFKLPSVTIANDRITGTLESLLRCVDHEHQIYFEGQQRFILSLDEADTDDMLSATPLEAAFTWSLSCIASANGYLRFSNKFTFALEPQHLQAGRLFGESNQLVTNSSTLTKHTVLYYVDEKKREGEEPKLSHPLCDLWFLTNNNQLVLIDVTGGVNSAAKKMEKLKKWINSRASQELPYETFGIVLAPGDHKNSEEDATNNVCAVRGKDARQLLGGLAQCWEWFV